MLSRLLKITFSYALSLSMLLSISLTSQYAWGYEWRPGPAEFEVVDDKGVIKVARDEAFLSGRGASRLLNDVYGKVPEGVVALLGRADSIMLLRYMPMDTQVDFDSWDEMDYPSLLEHLDIDTLRMKPLESDALNYDEMVLGWIDIPALDREQDLVTWAIGWYDSTGNLQEVLSARALVFFDNGYMVIDWLGEGASFVSVEKNLLSVAKSYRSIALENTVELENDVTVGSQSNVEVEESVAGDVVGNGLQEGERVAINDTVTSAVYNELDIEVNNVSFPTSIVQIVLLELTGLEDIKENGWVSLGEGNWATYKDIFLRILVIVGGIVGGLLTILLSVYGIRSLAVNNDWLKRLSASNIFRSAIQNHRDKNHQKHQSVDMDVFSGLSHDKSSSSADEGTSPLYSSEQIRGFNVEGSNSDSIASEFEDNLGYNIQGDVSNDYNATETATGSIRKGMQEEDKKASPAKSRTTSSRKKVTGSTSRSSGVSRSTRNSTSADFPDEKDSSKATKAKTPRKRTHTRKSDSSVASSKKSSDNTT